MSHIPFHGIQTKAQRLSSLANQISRAGGLNAFMESNDETLTPFARTPKIVGIRNPRVPSTAKEQANLRHLN